MENKIIEDDVIKAELQDGISQVSDTLTIDEFESVYEKDTRKLRVHCTVKDSASGEMIEINKAWG